MATAKMGDALMRAFGHKVVCDAEFIRAYEAMRDGETSYNPSKLASALERCDDAQVEFWRVLRQEMKAEL